jgi:hypothetical protein
VPLPSLHDVECWKLDREDLGRVYEMYLEKAVQEWVGNVGASSLRGFVEYWWVDTREAEERLDNGVLDLQGKRMAVCGVMDESEDLGLKEESANEDVSLEESK